MAKALSRAERFAKRLRKERLPTFAELGNPPAWVRLVDEDRGALAAIMALLAARPAIDAELSGPSLAELAATVGEDRFDLVCEVDPALLALPDTPMSLPFPHDLVRRGEELLQAAQERSDLAGMAQIADGIRVATDIGVAEAAAA